MAKKQQQHENASPRLKRELLLAALPKYRFKIATAAVQEGLYGRQYANGDLQAALKKDPWFQDRLRRLIDQNLENSKDKIRALDSKLDYILDTGALPDGQRVSPNVYLSFLTLRYKRLNALTERLIQMDDTPTPAITPEVREAARKASIKLMETQGKAG